jgi:hypothetical protein
LSGFWRLCGRHGGLVSGRGGFGKTGSALAVGPIDAN